MSATRIVIIAKAPIPGFAKTRLIPALGAEGAARLAERMLHHTVNSALAAALGPVELCATPAPDAPAWARLDLSTRLAWSEQGDGDLGARMARAAERTLSRGERVVLIGTDCPALGAAELRWASRALDTHDAFMQPTVDGGYALLALRAFHPLIFHGIRWSTDSVAFETLCRAGRLGWSVQSHPPVHDIDSAADVRWLPSGLNSTALPSAAPGT
ncbi:TIGR04282 family arsenosugar biosynthesis glycosyltransferase [Aromatoleum toluclasticum]|uniref:TIGR04282 family arsenosugar biosynthesis glycosyltransferase n=1 Tax=Aromatoleum toluclasticum TaxID=92003 RepID=UPI001D18926A|nr:TIGR04282 family arsenosugar biosynthesis glycosyltransferase [Aromatoleum toluclasticum]MCC4118176.1 TIGR04282 family arsenosugar biosynthesis glycosyltransferase [Aromatoleum toluclasticum]